MHMTGSVETTTSDREALAAEFPGWHIWQGRTESDTPRGWYATRLGARPSAREGRNGLYMTVHGDTAEALRAQLNVQAQREAQL